MRPRTRLLLAGLLVVGGSTIVRLSPNDAAARAPASCTAESIGLARTIEIDAKGGARYGEQQYHEHSPLKEGEVVLTFDDGPHKTLTPTILDALDAHCTKATFFMVGQRALAYPELVRKVATAGHSIATHTWTHQNLARIDRDAAVEEIELGISAVQKSLGIPAAPFFRFPYLSDPKAMTAHLRQRDTAIFSIDVDSYDFKTRSPTVVIRNVMKQLDQKKKGIILFHDIQVSTAGALDTLLKELKAKGYKVVHFAPAQGQTTLAEYDNRVQKKGSSRIAALPVPVAQRSIVSPAWDVQVYRGQGQVGTPSGGRGYDAFSQRAAPPPPPPQPRPVRRQADDDWQTRVFRGGG